jgi:hypothetical protein
MQYLEQYQFWDKYPQSKPHEDFSVGLQRLARFGIVCVMPRHQVSPLRANKPGAILPLAHRNDHPTLAAT